jgi:hypothetical protein
MMMFRRIEMIYPRKISQRCDGMLEIDEAFKAGLMACGDEKVIEAWFDKLNGPGRSIPRNAKFYFTESGWQEVGRHVVTACQQAGQEYRVIKTKENEVNVVWRQMYEVAAQPKPPRKLDRA